MDNGPLGGRSVNEFALEARYRFGNFGIVPFVDAGQVYRSSYPQFSDIRFGVGIGGRYYTNFGPVRVDVAVPINRRPGERSEEHTSELQSLMRISYAVFCLKKKTRQT